MEKLNIWLIFGLTLASFVSAAPPRLGGRIVGGQEADIKDITFQVSLQRTSHFCGGSLIAKRYVLTAAHCTDGQPAINPNFMIRLGSTYSAKEGLLVKPIKIYQHEKYNARDIDYDFSVIVLEDYDDSSLSLKIEYANLSNESDIKDGTVLTVSGWGNTQNALESRDVLRAVKVPKVNDKVCSKAYNGFNVITERMICAGQPEGGKDACQGDSGGPLFKDNILVGVVSWGYGCAKPNYPGVYSRVSSAFEWINEQLQKDSLYREITK